MKVWAIICAAGSGERYAAAGGHRSKLDEDLGGRPVLQRAVELFVKREEVAGIVVAGPPGEEDWEAFRARHADRLAIHGAVLVRGGQSHRWETVRSALEHVPSEATHIAVHDAARPATPPELIERLLELAAKHPAVLPGVAVSDTLKRVGPAETDSQADPVARALGLEQPAGPSVHPVLETADRTGLMAAQTPQVFEADLLRRAYRQEDLSSTDDAQLVERVGEAVVIVEGDARNVKITRPGDLHVVRALLGVRAGREGPVHKRF